MEKTFRFEPELCRSRSGLNPQSGTRILQNLYSKNLNDVMSFAGFEKYIKMLSMPWLALEKWVMVTLEMPADAANAIIERGKMYILYFAFRTIDALGVCHSITV